VSLSALLAAASALPPGRRVLYSPARDEWEPAIVKAVAWSEQGITVQVAPVGGRGHRVNLPPSRVRPASDSTPKD
jgi:hypothetical protein